MKRTLVLMLLGALAAGCHRGETPASPQPSSQSKPSILFVTLDTTRADAIGPEAKGIETPAFNALAATSRRYRFAYTAVPQTLPAHTSMLTGLYPAGHGLHENGRYLAPSTPLLAEKLHAAGYRTAAFVSAFALAKRFGLARGFDVYDDAVPEPKEERTARETTDRVLAFLLQPSTQPTFLWVHYYDPHFPYEPPEPFRTKFAKNPYLGEVASMDEQLGRLTAAFRAAAHGDVAIIVVGDHGEGLGEHGEAQHGNLLYQSTVHVPLIVCGPGVRPGVSDAAVSTRRLFHTILDFAGIDATNSLRGRDEEVVVGEAMKPFLDYGWQPQVMAVEQRMKTIAAGGIEVYDVVADPAEAHNLAPQASVSRGVRAALRDYPAPSPDAPSTDAGAMTDEERKKLASLGYVSATARPAVRADAPRPADMARLFPTLDRAAGLFVREQYAAAIPLLQQILAADPNNLDSALRLATCYSSLGRDADAVAAFERAQRIAPQSQDVETYFALHLARGKDWTRAVPMLEDVLQHAPQKVPVLEALAIARERQGRLTDAIALRQRTYALRTPTGAELAHLGALAMQAGDTATAIDAFERAQPGHDLELGVLYLAAGRYAEAAAALDRVSPSSPDYPLALFKRAQVSVLLHEPDAAARIANARAHANATTAPLIERERLFR